MNIKQKLFDKYGDEVIIQKAIENHYNALRMHTPRYNQEGKTIKGTPIEQEVEFTDFDIGIEFFFNKEDIGNRSVLYDPNSAYYFNIKNIKKAFETELETMGERLPRGPLMFGKQERQNVINSFYDEKENQNEEAFIKKHSSCFARMDLDTEYCVGHDVKYFDEHFHDKLYLTKGPYRQMGNLQLVNWRSDIANMYYAKNILQRKSRNYVDVISSECDDIAVGFEYIYQVMLRRNFVMDPSYNKVDTYICGIPEGNFAKEQELYKSGEIDPFLLNVLEQKRKENKLTDIVVSIQANQNAIIRHDHKKNMIVQGCAGSGKTMILLHRISYLKYNNLLRNLKRATMIVPNTRFNIFIDEVSTNLEISDMPRYTMAQYYLELIEKYQRQIYTDMVESNRPIIQKIQKIKKCDFLKTNGLDPNNVFGLDLEKDICNFYDQKFSEYLSDIHADRILELAQQFEIDTLFAHDVSKEKSNAKKLNYLKLYLQKILEILNRLTKKEQVALQEAKEKSTNYKTFKRHLKNLLHDMKALMYEYKVDQESSFYSLLERICPKRVNIEKLELLKKEADVLNTKIQSETSGFLRFETDEEDQSKLDILQNQINEIEQQISGEKEELPETLLRIFDNLEKFKKWREGNVYIVAKLGDILEKYDRLIDLIFHEDIAFSVLMLEFKELHRSFNNSEETQNVKRQIEIAQDSYNKAREQVLSLEDQEIVDHAHEQLEIRAELVIRFFEMFEDTGFAEINNARQLFIILAMYLLHVGKIIIDFDYVFIDEAQDYSDIEYRLLRGIHGKNTIIELYGDYMQKITPNRGIDNWNALKPMFSNEYYELKENYRNTVEIANYVNVHIKDIFTTIGLHGEIVYKLGNNWKQVVNHEVNETPERRVAVICKNETIKGEINSDLSSNATIYTVIEAKGLEFDSVYLIDKDMTDNEKYIACSRALKILNIVGSY